MIVALLKFLADDQDEALERLDSLRRALFVMARARCGIRRLNLDPDDLVQDTIMRVAELADRRELTRDNVEGFFSRTLDFIIREAVGDRWPEQLPAKPIDPAIEPDAELSAGCAGACLGRLAPEEREILWDYFERKDRKTQAADLKTSYGALRVRITQLRRRLRHCVTRCESENRVEI